jgi:hypothetical protein
LLRGELPQLTKLVFGVLAFVATNQLDCSKCGNVYGVNGTDIFEHKCPNCQSGKPGLPL